MRCNNFELLVCLGILAARVLADYSWREKVCFAKFQPIFMAASVYVKQVVSRCFHFFGKNSDPGIRLPEAFIRFYVSTVEKSAILVT